MYKIQWYENFLQKQWEDVSSHWFFYKARKKLCKMLSTGKYCQGQWRIVDDNNVVYLYINIVHGYNPDKNYLMEQIEKIYNKDKKRNYR